MTGSRGPLPKPSVLKLLQGNAGKRALDLSSGINPRIEVPSIPKHLGAEARKEWKRITPLLVEHGLISQLDRSALELYCHAYGRLAELEASFNGRVAQLVSAGMEHADAVAKVSESTTPSGYVQQSVIVNLINNQRQQLNRTLGHFGLSPALRGRVQPSNYVQPGLPGIPEKPQGFAQFGAR